jgi:hypothetical protein
VNDSRILPWLSGLGAAIVVAVMLIIVVVNGMMTVISGLAPQ